MPCPYLTEVRMVYCRASPVRKLIPTDRLTTASHCDTESYGTCPLFVEALGRAGASLGGGQADTQCAKCSRAHPEAAEGAQP